MVIQVYTPTTNVKETEQFYEDLQDLLKLKPKNDILFIIGGWNAKVGNQEVPGITGKFALGVQNEAGQRLTEFCQECTGHSKHPLPTTQEKTLHMDITIKSSRDVDHYSQNKIRLIIFFASKDGEALYSQQKQDWELTVAQIMNSLLPNSDLNWRKWRKPLDHSGT